MSQHDTDISNQTGAQFRADLNSALDAVFSNNSGATEPTTTHAYMWWADTASGFLKQRNAADSGWVNKLKLSQAYDQINNTADADKPISDDTAAALSNKEGSDTKIVKAVSGTLQIWRGDQATYDALTPDADTLYIIT